VRGTQKTSRGVRPSPPNDLAHAITILPSPIEQHCLSQKKGRFGNIALATAHADLSNTASQPPNPPIPNGAAHSLNTDHGVKEEEQKSLEESMMETQY
jgi:hypothetical protein